MTNLVHCLRMRISSVLVSALLLSYAAACSQDSGQIEAAQWKLIAWPLASIIPADMLISAKFESGKISGSDGVNTYHGPCRIGPGDAFFAGPLVTTTMTGPAPALLAGSEYLTLLSQARYYSVKNNRLKLYDQDENESLVFEAVCQ